MKFLHLVLTLAFILNFIPEAEAKRFTSQYLEFELPTGWDCFLEGTEYVCQSDNKDRKREAIIIFAAKIRGEQDSLDQYMTYLKQPKTFTLPGGKTQVSEAKYSKITPVNNQQWVDSLHMASEVPGFYTRYMATVVGELGVAVTFSVGRDFYDAYKPVFDLVINSMRAFAPKNLTNPNMKLAAKDSNIVDETDFVKDPNQQFGISQGQKKAKTGAMDSSDMIIYGVVGLGLVGFIIARRKKK